MADQRPLSAMYHQNVRLLTAEAEVERLKGSLSAALEELGFSPADIRHMISASQVDKRYVPQRSMTPDERESLRGLASALTSAQDKLTNMLFDAIYEGIQDGN